MTGTEWLRLRCAEHGKRAAKLWRRTANGWKADSYDAGTWFRPEIVKVPDAVEAWADLFRDWTDDAESLLVRGVLAREPMGDGTVRRAMSTEKGAWLAPHPIGRRVVVFDFDKIDPTALAWPDWPGFVRWPSREEAGDLVQRKINAALPDAFHGAACAYRWSASPGVPGENRGPIGWSRPSCHVAMVLDRPVYDASLRRWLKGKAEPSIACSVTPLYLAGPLFDDLAPEFPAGWERVGVLPGRPVVITPDELVDGEEWALDEEDRKLDQLLARAGGLARAKLVQLARPIGHDEREAARSQRYAKATIAGAVADLRKANEGDRHPTLFEKCSWLGQLVGGGLFERARIETEMFAVWCEVAPEREIEGLLAIQAGLNRGEREPLTWDEVQHAR